jgi:hypothetical protein
MRSMRVAEIFLPPLTNSEYPVVIRISVVSYAPSALER